MGSTIGVVGLLQESWDFVARMIGKVTIVAFTCSSNYGTDNLT